MTTDYINKNQRLPPLSLPGVYPYTWAMQDGVGHWERRVRLANNNHWSWGHPTGTFHEMTNSGSQKTLVSDQSHHYSTTGHTHTVDGNHDEMVAGSHVKRTGQDHYQEHGGDHFLVAAGDSIHAVQGIILHHATSGIQLTSSGHHVTDVASDSSKHDNVGGDDVKVVQGTKYRYVGGEDGEYVPNGNYDLNVGLKTNIQSGQDITITSGTTITLKVGSSTITMTSSSITIKSPAVNFVQG